MDSRSGHGEGGTERILILGLGNSMRRDDAVGLLVVRRLLAEGLPRDVGAAEVTGGGTSLLDRLGDCDRLIVVDALDDREAGHLPGSVVELDPASIRSAAESSLAGGHLLGVGDALALAEAVGLPRPVRVRVIGVQVADAASFSEECSPPVAAAVATACARIREMLAERGPGAGTGP
jgi:hydrogenase maturation protease